MTIDWQQTAVVLIVAAALVYVGHQARGVLAVRRSAGCGGGCGPCAAKATEVVQIAPAVKRGAAIGPSDNDRN